MKHTLLLAIAMLTFATGPLSAQGIEGLWVVKDVQVGDQSMTPVAKWARFTNDGKTESGNGWLKHSEGTWQYDEGTGHLTLVEKDGLSDPFGPFIITVADSTMTWVRVEEGAEVKVNWVRTAALPAAPWDDVQGLWDLEQVEKDGKDEMASIDPEGLHYLFIRWDRIYMARTADGGRETGYWHMNGHRPHLTLLPHAEGENPISWQIEVEGDRLIMKGLSMANEGLTRTYRRLNSFPE